jgi:hypothetical protein
VKIRGPIVSVILVLESGNTVTATPTEAAGLLALHSTALFDHIVEARKRSVEAARALQAAHAELKARRSVQARRAALAKAPKYPRVTRQQLLDFRDEYRRKKRNPKAAWKGPAAKRFGLPLEVVTDRARARQRRP